MRIWTMNVRSMDFEMLFFCCPSVKAALRHRGAKFGKNGGNR